MPLLRLHARGADCPARFPESVHNAAPSTTGLPAGGVLSGPSLPGALLSRPAKRGLRSLSPAPRTVGSLAAGRGGPNFLWLSDTLSPSGNPPLRWRFSEASAVRSAPVQTKCTRAWLRPESDAGRRLPAGQTGSGAAGAEGPGGGGGWEGQAQVAAALGRWAWGWAAGAAGPRRLQSTGRARQLGPPGRCGGRGAPMSCPPFFGA